MTTLPATPFFSVIICTYNRERLLPRALDSLLRQTETDWEAIIVDDGSADGTFRVADAYIAADARFRYMKHQNRGVGFSRTAGVFASLGVYCAFLDSDDEYLPEHLSSRRALLEAAPDIDILHGGAAITGEAFAIDRFDPTKRIPLSQCVLEGTMILRQEAARLLGGFGAVRYGEGAALVERARAAGMRIATADIPTYIYDRTTPDSLCSTFTGFSETASAAQ